MESKMEKFILEPLSKGEKALLRCLPSDTINNENDKKALIWFPGRNDTFYHHLAAQVILEAGYDLWLIDLRR